MVIYERATFAALAFLPLTDLRVTPGRMVPISGGVLMVFPLATKMLQLDTSSRYVSDFASRYTTSLKPFFFASS